MKVRLFPDGLVHSAYIEMLTNPPDNIEYIGDFKHAHLYGNVSITNRLGRYIFDRAGLPYIFKVNDKNTDYDLVHSCQKLVLTNNDFVIDIEHGNPFMGYSNIKKTNSVLFRKLVSKTLNDDRCIGVLPWSEAAYNAFALNFSFLGKEFMKDKVDVIYPAVSIPRIFPEKYDKFTFIFIGGGDMHARGVDILMESFDILKKVSDCDLIIVVNDFKDVEKLVRKYKVTERIRIYTSMPRNELLTMIGRSHCLVMPSMCDTFGMVALEAMARKLPIIMTDNFAAREIVSNYENGVLLKPCKNVKPVFDMFGRKILNKAEFHSQFKNYVPSDAAIYDLYVTMSSMVCEEKEAKKMGNKGFGMVSSGKFSIGMRNKNLLKAYNSN